ncbi:Ger(x)C family spore germination protein [Sporosarcina sp. Marseille-Q4063]|uniref:Ger(x)C family spore germination protein n=1 Tax=Sporosarcina sp. Marseille-Q4063 TaxID=2810514 RepID=UPI001BB09BEA|nr:Ger(x)C family spore germination protein [Sporosarcina sp. Marseille-Q4063]QUW22382.1 Ger(x)C family spore germination protein [Sporosarcina sp. Marseille-Q4063]
MRKIIVVVLVSLLLSGCWDEVLYQDLTMVPLAGIEGETGKITVHFSFPSAEQEKIIYSTTEGHGVSLREARNNAFMHTDEMLDIAQLEVFLISAETAKEDLYNYIDVFYRTPRHQLSGRMAVVEGEMKELFDKAETLPINAPDYYKGIIETAIKFSYIPDFDLQSIGNTMFDKSIDFALPSIRISEHTKLPEVSGVALFSDRQFSGHYLDAKESLIMTLMMKKGKKKKYAQFTYLWEENGVEYPITVEHVKKKKKWKITNDKIEATYKIKFGVEEFPHDNLDNTALVNKLNKFLSEQLTTDFNKVIKKLQEAKSDSIGFGQNVRAFHRELWEKGKWQDTFSEMDINVKVEAEITRSGILN